jgi:A/G-specific adenine glycosylase
MRQNTSTSFDISRNQSKVSYLRKHLLSWYQTNGRDFLWRSPHATSYQIVIGELLLQRTKAENVALVYKQFISSFSSWKKLSSASENEISRHISKLGLQNRRVLVLTSLSKVMIEKKGRLPKNRNELEALPGIGQYIANAILTICHGKREPLLDINMARLLERFFGPRKLADIRDDPYLQELSRSILSKGDAITLNWAILDFASKICTKNNPIHLSCPIRNKCSFSKNYVSG